MLPAALRTRLERHLQHLGLLRKHGVLDSRREGTSVYYRVKDPRTFQLLEVARQILTTNLTQSQRLLSTPQRERAGLVDSQSVRRFRRGWDPEPRTDADAPTVGRT